MAYDKHTWNIKEAITKSKMQNIEDGIEAASNKADANETNISTLNNKVGNIDVNNGGSISQRLSSMSGDIQTLKNTNVGALTTRLESVENQVNAARGDTEPRPNLAQVLADMRSETARVEREYKSADTTINSNITTAQNTADAAISALNLAKGNSESVADRIAAIETVNRTQDTDITTLKGRMNTPITGDTKSVEQHLSSLHTDVNSIQSEIETARGVDNLNVARQNLNARFVDEETRLSNAEGRLATLETSTGTTIPNRIGAVEGRVSTAEGKIANIESELTSAKDTYGSIDARFDAVEATANAAAVASTVNTALDGLDGRLDAIDGGSALDTTNGTLANRVSAAESAISHAADAGNSDPGGLTERLTAAEIAIGTKANSNDMETALAGKVSTSDFTTAINGLAAKDTIIVSAPTEGSNYTNDVPNLQEPSINCDYLIEDDNGQYFYWRYIDNNWELISGASNSESGGGGTSSGEFVDSLQSINTPDENKDYFVGNDIIGYTHYRYIPSETEDQNGTFVKILPKGLLTNARVDSNGKPIITTLEDTSTNVLNSFNALKTVNCVTTYDKDNVTPKSYELSFTDINGREYVWDLAAGGGGSSYTVQFIDESGNLDIYVPNNANSAIISARIYARLGTDLLSQTGSITVKYKAESASEYTTAQVISGVANNAVTNIEIIDLLQEDSITNIQLTASIQPEDTPITRNLTYTVHRVPMSIEPYNYNPASIKTNNFIFQYYCIGSNLAKIVHFVIDGVDTTEDVGTPANTDLLTKQINVDKLERGMHSLKVYFTVSSFSSNEINTYFLYDDGTQENVPIIALSTEKSSIQYGENLNLNYTVYTKGLEKTEEVTLETYVLLDNVQNTYETKNYINVDNGIEQLIPITNYPSSGTFYMKMTAKNTVNNVEYTDSKTISITIREYESDYDSQMVRVGQANLIYEYDAAGRTNNDSDKEEYKYTFNSVSGVSEIFSGKNIGFNWASNGYTNGSSLLISGGATHSVNVPLFTSRTNNVSLETDTDNDDILKNGRTFEIDYEVNTATNLNAVIASFGNGLKITPSVSYLVPQNTTVTVNSHGLIEKEDEICAAYLATGKRMHMVFVIEPKSTTPTSQGEYHQCVNIYINGEFVNSCPYALSDDFSTDSTFTIGSNTCIINLYSIRMYNRGLTNDEVLRNYMMAPNTKMDKISRFAANDVLNNNKLVDYNKARNKFNCLLITGEISPYKKETKTPSGVTLTKPDIENLSYTTEFNLLDKKSDGTYYSSNNVQGTSSQTYPIHNLKVYLAQEEVTTSTDPESGEEITTTASKKYKYSLKGANGIAESTLCWKADYMSTDHANTFNANFANDLFTDKLPSQVIDPKVQNTVYGIRCLLFQRDDENSTPVFIADGCLNNDKGNNNAFGLSIKNESISDTTRQKWEFTNNSSALDFFKADGLLAISNDGYYAKTAFESTFPDEGDLEDEGLEPNYNHLQVLLTWVHQRANYWDADNTPTGTVSYDEINNEYTTTGTVYTYNGIPYSNMRDYKKAIFKNEFTQHFNLNHTLTYHLFSEFIALCDNRAKNMFLRCDNVRNELVKDRSNNTIFNGNSNPNASFFTNTTNIGTQEDPIYAISNADQIDWENSTFAIWYPVLYDLDSCYGVENVGRITIPYDADWNYVYNNKNQFSGVDSRLWLMVEDAFADELKTLAQTLYPNSLNYNTFYTTQIQAMLDSVCPAIINQDMLLKFNAYWADGFIDYSLPNNPHVYRDYKYIQRGSRAYQKNTFIKLRANYLSSKYTTSNFMNDQIHFRSSVIIPISNSGITLTTNQTLYPAITYGDNKPAIRSTDKIGPGESITLYASDQVGNTDTIHIGGASALTDIGDISKFEPYNLDVSGGVNLKTLIVGSDNINASTNKIDGLGSCKLLETLNVRNCTGFSGTLNISGNGLIKNVYTSGSGITNIELCEGGRLTNIEYGALTSSIKILNHGSLESFVYENSSNNHYENLRKLWIENTPNVPVVDIINNALGHLTNGVRIIGLNVNLGTDATFLQTITSDLAKGKYINSAGVQPVGTTAPPTITGEVTITSIRRSLYDKLKEMYPNLIINVTSEIIPEYTITYYDYDGKTVLYEDHKTSSERYIDPVKDTNPITGTYYRPMPTRNPDQQYNYYFGLYPSNAQSYDVTTYRRFTGWNKVTTGETIQLTNAYVTGNTTVVASYGTTELRSYTVEWYAETTDPTPIYSLTSEYGTRIGDYSWPDEPGFVGDGTSSQMIRAKRVNDSYYRIFTGWDRPVGILTDNVKIYGQWENSYISAATSSVNFNDLTAADLYALASVDSTTRTNLLQSHFNLDTIKVPLGNDFNYTQGVNATTLINEETPFSGDETDAIVYDGTHNHAEIRPFSTLHDFTLVIDYKPLLLSTLDNGATEHVLVSCYKKTNSIEYGFKISVMNTGNTLRPVVVTWGAGDSNSRYTIIDYVEINSDAGTNSVQYSHAYRNVVVLSYSVANPNLLTVYYPTLSNSPSLYSTSMTATVLTYPTVAFDAPLIIGGNYDYTDINDVSIEASNDRTPSSGIIYWAKYWDKDLGSQNCYKLAAWPHEELHFYMTGYDSAASEGDSKLILPNTKLSFVTASAMGDRVFDAEQNITFSGEYASYSTSSLATFYTNRIYAAFPTSYQSVIPLLSITTNNSNVNNITNEHLTYVSDQYVYPPAEIELFNVSSQSKIKEAKRSWPYLKTSILANANMVYELLNNSLVRATTVNSIAPFLYRFNNYYMNANTKIFNTGSRDPYNNGNAWTVANVGTIRLASGDIWITDNGVYVYVSDEDIDRGINIDIAESKGGWKQSEAWLLRTYTEAQADATPWYYFIGVTADGKHIDGGTTSKSAFGRYKGLVYEFAL